MSDEQLAFINEFYCRNDYMNTGIVNKESIQIVYDLFKNEKVVNIDEIHEDNAISDYACYYLIKNEFDKALYYLQIAIKKNNAIAMNNMGNCYADGKGVEQDDDKAYEMYKKSAELNNTSAMVNLGTMYYNKQDYEQAVKWYQKAIDLKQELALFPLGICYETGKGVTCDSVKAHELFQKAAKFNDRDAIRALGDSYYYKREYKTAIYYYEKAIHFKDNNDTLVKLADCYYEDKSYDNAFKFYKDASDLGDIEATNKLADCYCNGEGVEQNFIEAVRLYMRNVNKNDNHANFKLRRLMSQEYRTIAAFITKS